MIANVSAIFILPVFEKSSIFSDCRAVAHSISAQEGGNTVCWKAMARKKTVNDSMTYSFPSKHPMVRLRGIEFWSHATKMGSSAGPYGPRLSVPNLGSALWASPIASFGAFPRKHNPNVGSALRASPFERRKCPGPPLFCPFDVHLAVSNAPLSTPTTPLRPRRV